MEAAIFGFIGAVIGSIASLGGIYIQQLHQSRHERLKMAVELATLEFSHDIELAKNANRATTVAPLPAYVACYSEYLDALSNGPASPSKVKEVIAKVNALNSAFDEAGEKAAS